MAITDEERRALLLTTEKHAPLVLPAILAKMGARPSACREACEMAAADPKAWMIDAEGELINAETKQSPEEWCAAQRTLRPHYWLPEDTTGETALKAWGDESLGVPRGNLTSRAERLKQLDGNYAALVEEAGMWGCTINSLKPGRKPATAGTAPEPNHAKQIADASNPWTKAGWNITKQGSVVRAMGLDGAARMAAKAGSFIGATKPTK